jgi:translation initiation factor 2B subunit (eIF-2B alpha/beta/delta family)
LQGLQVIVAEGAPRLEGLAAAQTLTDAGIATLVIPDAAVFALMARVNKVCSPLTFPLVCFDGLRCV